jgi:hypothetical protein
VTVSGSLHAPAEHVAGFEHTVPHAPQLALSVCVSVQYGAPASGVQSV